MKKCAGDPARGADSPRLIASEHLPAVLSSVASVMAEMLGNRIVHNSEISAYLFDKVIYRASGEQVAILKSAITIEATKYFWQDPFKSKTIAERILF